MFADGKVALQTTYGYMWSGDYIKQQLGNNANQQWAYVSLWVTSKLQKGDLTMRNKLMILAVAAVAGVISVRLQLMPDDATS